jgi:glycosyltransferase involved in cell wall biosynthesis
MMRVFFRLVFLPLAFLAALYGGRHFRLPPAAPPPLSFQPSQYPVERHPFVIVVVGRNNGAFVDKTLRSILDQVYEPYRLIYIDDASDDGSFELARDLINQRDDLARITLVRNEARLGLVANLARAIQTCEDREIVVVIAGTDWLAHRWVLQTLNQYYADPDVWFSLSRFCEYPQYATVSSAPVRRDRSEGPFHLKAFYAGLFKKIALEDWNSKEKLTVSNNDLTTELAYLAPIAEMAQGHFALLEEVLYIANRLGVSEEDREAVLRAEKGIRAATPYLPLSDLSENSRKLR